MSLILLCICEHSPPLPQLLGRLEGDKFYPMKFGKRLQEEMIEAWADHYVSYKRLKRIISQKEDKVKQPPSAINKNKNNADARELEGPSINPTIERNQREAFVSNLFAAVREELRKAEKHMETVEDELRETFTEITTTDNIYNDVNTPRSRVSGDVLDASNTSDHRGSFVDNVKNLAAATVFPRKTRKSANSPLSTISSGAYVQMVSEVNLSVAAAAKEGRDVSSSGGTRDSRESDSLVENAAPAGQYTDTASSTAPQTTLVPLQYSQLEDTEPLKPQKTYRDEMTVVDRVLEAIRFKSDEEKALENLRVRFVAWYGSATRLLHFADLNLEAVRKASKKVAKYHPEVGDLTNRFGDEIQASYLTRSMRDLEDMIERAKIEFERRFDSSLEKYGDLKAGKEVWHCKWRFVILAACVYAIAMSVPIFADHPRAHSCVSLFAVVVTLWITEAIPFFCTAMLIPLIAVPSSIIADPDVGGTATAPVAAKIMLGHVFDHVQILVLGGLTIAKAMSRTNLELLAAAKLHELTAHSPKIYLLGVMVLSCVVCTFVSNVASPLLVLGVIHSTLWEFPQDTTAPQGILLGLAFACNLGGMLSPIASPQNAVAMQVLGFSKISFASWVGLALPIVALTLVGTWFIILVVWKPFEHVQYIPLQPGIHNAAKAPRSHVYFVIVVSLVTIVLWCLPPGLLFGDTGIIALIPIVCFFGVGILKKDDFNNLSWHLMFLLAGGNMLGLCAKDSKMLDLLAGSLQERLQSQAPYVTLVAILIIVCFITTFVSHTVAAMILLPIIAEIGALMPGNSHPTIGPNATTTLAPGLHHRTTSQVGANLEPANPSGIDITPELLVFLSTLMCSAAMAFPISSFPNVNSLLAEDDLGRPYLKARDFLVTGLLVTFVFFISCATWMVPYFNIIM